MISNIYNKSILFYLFFIFELFIVFFIIFDCFWRQITQYYYQSNINCLSSIRDSMFQLDEQIKLAKFKKFQVQLNKDVQKKNKPKMWEEIDDLEKQQRQIMFSDGELSPQSKRKRIKKIKPDKKQQKLKQVAQYEKALQRHRNQPKFFHSPYEVQRLNMNQIATIKALQQAKNGDKDIPLALKKVGIKSLKTLYLGGAKKQFDIVLNFLKERTIPDWVFEGFQELMKKQPHQFNGTVKSLMR